MLLQLTKLTDSSVESLRESFSGLPETEHLDGKYRLRRYSVVQCTDKDCDELEIRTFNQSDEYNKFQGNMTRRFDPVEESVVHSSGMLEMCSMFKSVCGFPDDQKIDVHQMRVITLNEETPVSPEGIHQDGYDYICIVGIDRSQVEGGHLLVYSDKESDPFLSLPLSDGVAVMLNDRLLWHNASKITATTDTDGYVDAFILTAKEDMDRTVFPK